MPKKKHDGQPHPMDVHAGKRLKMGRYMRGLNQRKLGQAIDVTFQQVQKYEHGTNRMGTSTLYEFARLLNVPESFFFEGFADNKGHQIKGMAEPETQGFEHEMLAPYPSDKEVAELIKAYSKASEENRATILEMAKLLAKK